MKEIKNPLTVLAVAGNILFVLWILYNGINEGFEGTVPEKLSYIGLMGLLAVNTILLLTGRAKQSD
jgi:hypothetical protein